VKIDHTQTTEIHNHVCIFSYEGIFILPIILLEPKNMCVRENEGKSRSRLAEKRIHRACFFIEVGGAFYDSNTHILPVLRCNLPCYAVHFYLFAFFYYKIYVKCSGREESIKAQNKQPLKGISNTTRIDLH